MTMGIMVEERKRKEEGKEVIESSKLYTKGVRYLCDSGITKVPSKYILPPADRPIKAKREPNSILKLPIIDFACLQSPDRFHALQSIANACKEYGFFQVVNHGVSNETISRMLGVGKRFFELPIEERERYMSKDLRTPVRYGTSLNQMQDDVFFWRDFLKLSCHPIDSLLQYWPTSPVDLREEASSYAKQTKSVFLILMVAILETLGLKGRDDILNQEFNDGTHLMFINHYPACPEPNLTLGLPPHSDYGFLTLLLQDPGIHGLEVQYKGDWLAIEPIANSFVVNIGDHLEIFSNGMYKSVLHRVLVNPAKSRISVASLHSLPYETMVIPSPNLVNEDNPKLYVDTDFASFMDFISTSETKHKNFLETRKLTQEKRNETT